MPLPETSLKIVICCPGDVVTGGPELLHQLGAALISINKDAVICYYPFEKSFECPERYRVYNVPQIKFANISNGIVVIPEAYTKLALKFPDSKIVIWWLSVENYFRFNRDNRLSDIKNYFKTLFKRRLPVFFLRNYRHLAQSHYALTFLKKNKICANMLTDYLSSVHFNLPNATGRENIILYNPRKGKSKTSKLISHYEQFTFLPLEKLSADEMAHWFARAKLYIDFGHHPGKDRMPREAAIAGCCVVVGRQGSAAHFEDIPIPDAYKLDDESNKYVSDFGKIVTDIFDHFDQHSSNFDFYREAIRREPALFLEQVGVEFGGRQSADRSYQ